MKTGKQRIRQRITNMDVSGAEYDKKAFRRYKLGEKLKSQLRAKENLIYGKKLMAGFMQNRNLKLNLDTNSQNQT